MTTQHFLLRSWGWECVVFYDTVREDADVIIEVLKALGCSGVILESAESNLRSGEMNTGLTFTSVFERLSVSVISRATETGEFFNTMIHEAGHVATHIAETMGISQTGERKEYILGSIAQQMFPVAVRYLCRCKMKIDRGDEGECLYSDHGN